MAKRRKIRERRLEVSGSADHFTLCYLTDLHLGAAACDEDLLKQDIQRIKDNNWRWIGGGDYIEAISVKDSKRFESGAVAEWVKPVEEAHQIQVERTIEVLRPIAHLCDGLVMGNHSLTCRKWNNYNPYREICKWMVEFKGEKWGESELPMGYGDYLAYRIKKHYSTQITSFVVWAHHGHGGGGAGLPGDPALKMGRALDRHPSADLVLYGHKHLEHAISKVNERLRKSYLYEIRRYGVWVPGYLRARISKSDLALPPVSYMDSKDPQMQALGTFPIDVSPFQEKTVLHLGG